MKKILQRLLAGTFCLMSISSFAQKDSLIFKDTVQIVVVPGCVDSIIVDLAGAQGGGAYHSGYNRNGGLGGRAQATIPVHAGDSLFVYVGGMGDSAQTGILPGAGGYNGGDSGEYNPSNMYAGGGGGGGTDIRLNGRALANRIIVGGGGGGGGIDCSFAAEAGGYGGGLMGDSGAHCDPYYGYGGTQVAGGAGGAYPGWGTGVNGMLGHGGKAGYPGAGGGGGGGYYGGGGGSWGGGGGGSGYITPASASGTQTNGYKLGNGYAVITMKNLVNNVASVIDSSIMSPCLSSLWALPSGGTPPYTYLWSPGSSSKDTIKNLCTGIYTVIVTDKNGCKDTNIVDLIVNGIDELSNNSGIKIYPVPATGILNIDITNNNIGLSSMSVFDVTGKQVMEENTSVNAAHVSLDVSKLDNGVYFLRLKGNQAPQKDIRFEIVR